MWLRLIGRVLLVGVAGLVLVVWLADTAAAWFQGLLP